MTSDVPGDFPESAQLTDVALRVKNDSENGLQTGTPAVMPGNDAPNDAVALASSPQQENATAQDGPALFNEVFATTTKEDETTNVCTTDANVANPVPASEPNKAEQEGRPVKKKKSVDDGVMALLSLASVSKGNGSAADGDPTNQGADDRQYENGDADIKDSRHFKQEGSAKNAPPGTFPASSAMGYDHNRAGSSNSPTAPAMNVARAPNANSNMATPTGQSWYTSTPQRPMATAAANVRNTPQTPAMINVGAPIQPPPDANLAVNVDPPPPDFWYWLPTNEKLREWDVLCGRGGESNNFVGNRRYRSLVHDRKDEYRKIPVQQRKLKTQFVKTIVQEVQMNGGRFVDLYEPKGWYYVVMTEKARKKTSQALRETKELKWINKDGGAPKPGTPVPPPRDRTKAYKNSLCRHCGKRGHKTRLAKTCDKHWEYLLAKGKSEEENEPGATTYQPFSNGIVPQPMPTQIQHHQQQQQHNYAAAPINTQGWAHTRTNTGNNPMGYQRAPAAAAQMAQGQPNTYNPHMRQQHHQVAQAPQLGMARNHASVAPPSTPPPQEQGLNVAAPNFQGQERIVSPTTAIASLLQNDEEHKSDPTPTSTADGHTEDQQPHGLVPHPLTAVPAIQNTDENAAGVKRKRSDQEMAPTNPSVASQPTVEV